MKIIVSRSSYLSHFVIVIAAECLKSALSRLHLVAKLLFTES